MLTKDKCMDKKEQIYILTESTKANTKKDNILFGAEQNNYGGEVQQIQFYTTDGW